MASFEPSYARTDGIEKGVNTNPHDSGNNPANLAREFTYRGIALKMHPDWAGKPLIDRAIDQHQAEADAAHNDPEKLRALLERILPHDLLAPHVADLYRREYWTPLHANALPQDVADLLFDVAVNSGVRVAGELLQHSLNTVNSDGHGHTLFGPDLKPDGVIGTATLSAVNSVCAHAGTYRLLGWVLITKRGNQYCEYSEKRLNNRVFLNGWKNRIESFRP